MNFSMVGSEMINCGVCNRLCELGIIDFCDNNADWICRKCCKCKECKGD